MTERHISDEDLQILCTFQFKHTSFLSQSAFRALPFVFPQIHVPSIEHVRACIHQLLGLKIAVSNCCMNSCCCFLRSYKNDDHFLFCRETCYLGDWRTARKKYCYSQLLPHLCAMYKNEALAKGLFYCHEYKKPEPVNVGDLNFIFPNCKLHSFILK